MTYMQKYIYSAIHSIIRYVKYRTNVNRGNRTGIEAKESEKRNAGTRIKRAFRISECCSVCKFNRGSGQDSKQLCKQDSEGKVGSGSYWQKGEKTSQEQQEVIPKIPLFLFFHSYNFMLLLQCIDDICFQLNPTLLGMMLT